MARSPLTGSCLCGAVRFELDERPTDAGYCHCTRCQRRSGTAASPQARIDGRAFHLTGGRGIARRVAAPRRGLREVLLHRCGAHLFSRNPDDPTQMSIRMAAFDEDPGVRPRWRAFVAYAAPWEPIPDDGLERHQEGRPR
jgi:hypothetical protein